MMLKKRWPLLHQNLYLQKKSQPTIVRFRPRILIS